MEYAANIRNCGLGTLNDRGPFVGVSRHRYVSKIVNLEISAETISFTVEPLLDFLKVYTLTNFVRRAPYFSYYTIQTMYCILKPKHGRTHILYRHAQQSVSKNSICNIERHYYIVESSRKVERLIGTHLVILVKG